MVFEVIMCDYSICKNRDNSIIQSIKNFNCLIKILLTILIHFSILSNNKYHILYVYENLGQDTLISKWKMLIKTILSDDNWIKCFVLNRYNR